MAPTVQKTLTKVTKATQTTTKTIRRTKPQRKTNKNSETQTSNSLQKPYIIKDSELPTRTGFMTKHHLYAIILFAPRLPVRKFGDISEMSDNDKECLSNITRFVAAQDLKTYIKTETIKYPLRCPHIPVLGTPAWLEAGQQPDQADPRLPQLPKILQLNKSTCCVQDQKWLENFATAEYTYITKIRDWLTGLFSNFCHPLDYEFGNHIMDKFRERLEQYRPRVMASLSQLPIDRPKDWKAANSRMKLATLKKLEELVFLTLIDIEEVQHDIHSKAIEFQTIAEEYSVLTPKKLSEVEQYRSHANLVDSRQNNFLGYPKTPLDFARQHPDEAREFVDILMAKQYQKYTEDYRQYWEIIVSYHVNRDLGCFVVESTLAAMNLDIGSVLSNSHLEET